VPRLERITRDYRIMHGRPCIRGMRVTVGTIVGLLAQGHSRENVLDAYPYLERKLVSRPISLFLVNHSRFSTSPTEELAAVGSGRAVLARHFGT